MRIKYFNNYIYPSRQFPSLKNPTTTIEEGRYYVLPVYLYIHAWDTPHYNRSHYGLPLILHQSYGPRNNHSRCHRFPRRPTLRRLHHTRPPLLPQPKYPDPLQLHGHDSLLLYHSRPPYAHRVHAPGSPQFHQPSTHRSP
jgi:hypothetical protein